MSRRSWSGARARLPEKRPKRYAARSYLLWSHVAGREATTSSQIADDVSSRS